MQVMWNVCQCEICCCLKSIEDFSKRLLESFFLRMQNLDWKLFRISSRRLHGETSSGDFQRRTSMGEYSAMNI